MVVSTRKISMFYFNMATETAIRDKCVFLMLLRGESTRRMDLTDLFSLDFEDEGYSKCDALVLLMREGKAKHTGRAEYAATIRNKDYKRCAFGSLALYLFSRWQIENEPFPSFRNSADWLNIKVIKSTKGELTEKIDYKTQWASICMAFDACGINSRKKTHAGRGCGARHAEIAGASEDQLRRHGRWNAQSMENNYLTSFPRQSIRVINGFPGAGGQFWLPRDSLEPSESLMSKVFPDVDRILPLVEPGYEDDASIEGSSGYPKMICSQGFLNFLKKMRRILLQDSVFLRLDFPNNTLFCHPLFRDPEYLQFESSLLEICRNQDSPQELKLRDVVPELEVVISNLSMKVDTVAAVLVQNNLVSRPLPATACAINSEDILSINQNLHNINSSFDQLKVACSYFSNGFIPSSNTAGSPTTTASTAPTTASTAPSTAPPPASTTASTTASIIASTTPTAPPQYKMQRWIKSVNDLWYEYFVGFKIGDTTYISIQKLNEMYQSKWQSETERKMYSRRVVIIDRVKEIAQTNGGDIDSAVWQLENRRKAEKWTLNKLNEVPKREQRT